MLKRIKFFLSTLVAFFLAINVSIAHADNGKQFPDATKFDPTKIALTAMSNVAYGAGVPVGTVVAWPYASLPGGSTQSICTGLVSEGDVIARSCEWLICDGSTIKSSAYPELARIVGAKLPNYQGMFLRGYGRQNHSKNNGSTVGTTNTTHASGSLGLVQGDASRNMWAKAIPYSYHWWNTSKANMIEFQDTPASGALYKLNSYAGGAHQEHHQWNGRIPGFGIDASRVVPTANENRPVNVAVYYLIKAY